MSQGKSTCHEFRTKIGFPILEGLTLIPPCRACHACHRKRGSHNPEVSTHTVKRALTLIPRCSACHACHRGGQGVSQERSRDWNALAMASLRQMLLPHPPPPPAVCSESLYPPPPLSLSPLFHLLPGLYAGDDWKDRKLPLGAGLAKGLLAGEVRRRLLSAVVGRIVLPVGRGGGWGEGEGGLGSSAISS
jgi:hypothetical protein